MAQNSGSISKTLMWILMGLLILALAGFGAVSFTGTQRSIGSVGDQDIGIEDYARALQNEMRAIEAQTRQPLTFAQAQSIGLPQQVLSQLVVSTALDHEAFEMGISVGDERLARELSAIPNFQAADGSFDRQAYAFTLQNAGLTEAEFEADLRAETARTVLQGAVLAGTTMPQVYIDTLLDFAGERRAFTFVVRGRDDLDTPVPAPTDADLRAWYDENTDRFTVPESKMITFAWLTPAMILDTVDVDEATLRAAYDERAEIFNLPERRLVERLVYSDEATATAALARVTAGDATFEDLVAERGLDMTDVDMGDVTREELEDAGDPIFAAQTGETLGPLPAALGPALYRVNGVLAAQSTSFEEAEPALRDELALDRARRVIETQAQDFDDRLAGGATLEDLVAESEMQLGSLAWYPGVNAEIAGYEAFNEVARDIDESDFPAVEALGDGGVFAMRMDSIRPPTPEPYEEVDTAVRLGWEAAQVTEALEAQSQGIVTALYGGETFADLGLTPTEEEGLTRNASVPDVPPGVVPEVFEMVAGEVRALPGPGRVVIVRLDAVLPARRDGEEAQALAEVLQNQAGGAMAQDLFNALAADIQTRAGVEIDQTAINYIHTQFQ